MIFVVEGIHDKERLLKLNKNYNVLITGGSAINLAFINRLKDLSKIHEIVLLLDPDYQGRKIAKLINEHVKTFEIFIPREKAISKNKKKIGIEHVSLDTLRKYLTPLKVKKTVNSLTYSDFISLNLTGENSKVLRKILGERFNLGFCGAKEMYKRLNMYKITKEDILNLWKKLDLKKL